MASPIDLGALTSRLSDWDGLTGEWSFPYITQLTDALLERGHDIHVFALNSSTKVPRRYHGERLTVDVLPMREHGRDRIKDLYRLEREGLKSAIRESACDVVHAHWTYEFGIAAVDSGKPTVVTAHHSPWVAVGDARFRKPQITGVGRYTDMAKNGGRETVRALMSEYVVRNADVMTAVAPNVETHLNRWMFPRQPVRLIPNGLVPDPDTGSRALRDPEAPVFGLIANGFGARKNTVTAVKAFNRLRQLRPGARLILMGVGHEPGGPGQTWARSEGVDAGCEWRGEVPNSEAREALRREIDILVHTSHWEACSIAIMEAQALGVPVIGGRRSGGVSFSLKSGEAGLLVDVHEPSAVAAAMTTLVRDPTEFERLSIGGLEAIRSTFTMSGVLDAYEATYADAIRLHASSARR